MPPRHVRLVGLLWVLAAAVVVQATPEQKLLDWLAQRGGQSHLSVGRPCDGCPRGARAARHIGAGEVVARVPANTTLELGDGSPVEQAYRLLGRLRTDAAFAAEFKPYLAALPGPEAVLSPETFSDADLWELQTPELERLIQGKRAAVDTLYRTKGADTAGFTLDELKHLTGVVSSRRFVQLLGAQRLVPIADMVNHSEKPNTEFSDDGQEFVLLVATRDIPEGEELTTRYKAGTLHRPDASLFLYGFLPEESEAPLLCAVDLPSYNSWNPWRPTPREDRPVRPVSPGWAEQCEHSRLAGLLHAMATTENEDLALLGSSTLTDWRQRLLVQFRLHRKRALRLALDRMEQSWALGGASAPAPGCHASSKRQAGEAGDGQEGSSVCGADWAERMHALLQCPAGPFGGWPRLGAASQAAWELLLPLRARLSLLLPSAAVLGFLLYTTSLTTTAVVCVSVAAAVWYQL